MAMLLRDFRTQGIIFMIVCFVITISMVMMLRIWALWDNLYGYVCLHNISCGNALNGCWALCANNSDYFRFSRHSLQDLIMNLQ
jgi:hypothetical protein